MVFSSPGNKNSFKPADEIAVTNIILPRNPSKSINPNSIPTKILHLLVNV